MPKFYNIEILVYGTKSEARQILESIEFIDDILPYSKQKMLIRDVRIKEDENN
tara:strand:- start:4487 stop:4645 length:159 start_codon:yes stop_codon:yes gene_type:complete